MLSLKKKKQFEDEIAKNQGIQLTLENQIYSLESANMQKAVIDALELGNKSIKQINNNLNPDKIDELMDDIQEQADNSNTINQAIAQNLQQVYDDPDLLEELEQLEQLVVEEDINKQIKRIIFVDDDSPDNTSEHIKLNIYPLDVLCLRRIHRQGLSSAVIEGILLADTKYIAVMDADGQHAPKDLLSMLKIFLA